MKKIVIDNYPLSSGHSVRGMGMYTKNLIKSLKDLDQKELDIQDKNLHEVIIKADLIHYPYFDLFRQTLPDKKQAKKVVVTIPDIIPLIFPDKYPKGIRGKRKLNKNIKLLNYTDAVITISETSKKDIVRLLGFDPKKIFVTYLAPNFNFKKLNKSTAIELTKKYKLPKRFVLYVGDVNVNKDVQTLIKACIKANVDLVIVGKQAKDLFVQDIESKGPRDIVRGLLGKEHPEKSHFSQLNRLFKSKKVHRLGFLSNKELNAIWNLADLYVQPSLYEGFGLPVLEAMQAGVPVIISKTQALVEISGGAAEVFEIGSADELSEKILKILNSKKQRELLIKKGYRQSKKFSWEKQATEVLEVYRKTLLS